MNFAVTSLELHPKHVLLISDSHRSALDIARSSIRCMTTVEETFDAVIENYFELENELMFIIHREMIFSRDEIDMYKINGQISRRVINFMSAARLYVDQLPAQVSEIFGDKDCSERGQIQIEMSRHYDNRIGYRALEALRNYCQHRGYPIHNTIFGSGWLRSRSRPALRHSISPQIDTKQLALDKKFKKSVLRELENIGTLVPFKPLVRDYVEGLSDIHAMARKLFEAEFQSSVDILKTTRERYICSLPLGLYEEDLHVYYVNMETEKSIDDFIYIPDRPKLIEHFRQKNRGHSNLSKRFVTSEEIKMSD